MCRHNRVSQLAVNLAVNDSQSSMCDNINYVCKLYSICKYDLLKENIYPRFDVTSNDVSGAIRDFLYRRDNSFNPHDTANLNDILNWLCEN